MEKIKDYPGFSYFGAPLVHLPAHGHFALGMDAGVERCPRSARNTWQAHQQRADCAGAGRPQGCALQGKHPDGQADVDLCKLPVPLVHDGDGGRYVGTWHAVVTKHPVRGDVNWGMYRQMMFDSRTMSGAVFPFSDLGKQLSEYYLPRGISCPFATAIGLSPLAAMAACAPSPIPEPELVGMLSGEPARLVKCETNDLEVPADAEIIIEGEICPDYKVEEGPFGEYTGYRTSPRDFRVTFRVNCDHLPQQRDHDHFQHGRAAGRGPVAALVSRSAWNWKNCCAARVSRSPACTCIRARRTT
jgi:phenylphosphate carboxylase alpha subunit